MSRTTKNSISVQQLVSLLDHPKPKAPRSHIQPSVDRNALRKGMRLKWKDPGFCGVEFSQAPIIKPKMLNQWQMERINMAVRSYKKPKNSKPYRFDSESRQFPNLTKKIYPVKFQRYLKQVESEAQDLKFKEKNRAMTQGIQSYYTTLKNKQAKKQNFKPVSTNSTLFGFTMSTPQNKRYSNPHFKTMEI